MKENTKDLNDNERLINGIKPDKNGFCAPFYYPKNYPKYLPKRNDIQYVNISMIEAYELTNCIAFEMLIRTKEYKKLMDVSNKKIDEEWKTKMKNLGLDPSEAISIKSRKLLYPIGFFKGMPYGSQIEQDFSNFNIGNIENGLEMLIEFYIKKNEIFTVKETKKWSIFPKVKVNEYQIEKRITMKKILKNLKKYYIPCVKNDFLFQKDKEKCQLSENLWLVDLEKRFVETIANKISKKQKIQFYTLFKRPQLRFEESRILELEINLDLPKKELMAYMERIKDEYDRNHRIAKNTLDIIGINDSNINKKYLASIKSKIADTFFCYDYYEAKRNHIKECNQEIKNNNDENSTLQYKKADLKKLQNEKSDYKIMRPNTEQMSILNEKIINLQKEIDDETEKCKPYPTINKTSKNYIFGDNEFLYSNIKSHTAYNYYIKLAPYINKLQYKNLLTGNYLRKDNL